MNSVGIMLIPTSDHRYSDDGHVTLVYGGEIGARDQPDEQEMRMAAQMIAKMYSPVVAKTTGMAWMGQGDERVPAIILRSPELHRMRLWVERFNRSQYKVYKPHMSVPDYNAPVVPYVYLEEIALWWGDEHTTWQIGTAQRVLL